MRVIDEFARQKALRKMCDVTASILEEFTPEGLVRLIASGISPLDELMQAMPPEKLQEYRQKTARYRDVAASISDREVLAGLYKRVPQHASILQQHPTWFSAELARLRRLYFASTAPDQPLRLKAPASASGHLRTP